MRNLIGGVRCLLLVDYRVRLWVLKSSGSQVSILAFNCEGTLAFLKVPVNTSNGFQILGGAKKKSSWAHPPAQLAETWRFDGEVSSVPGDLIAFGCAHSVLTVDHGSYGCQG